MINVIQFSTVHRRFDTRVLLKECVSLASDKNYNVELILADGQGTENYMGVNISALPKAKTKIHRIIFSQFKMFKTLLGKKADIYHFHDPELMFTGVALKLLGRRVVFDIHEDFPAQLQSKVYLNRPTLLVLSKIYARIEHLLIKFFDYNITVNEDIQQRLQKSTKNVEVVHNYPILSEFTGIQHDWSNKERAICYVGGVTRIRGLKSLVKAAHIANCKLILGGSFDERSFEEELKGLPEWRNVEYLGQVSREEMLKVFQRSCLGIIPFLPEPNHINATPNKFFEYLSAGLPILTSSFPKWKQFIEENQVGDTFSAGDEHDLALKLNKLLEDMAQLSSMSKEARELVIAKRSWDGEFKKIKSVYTKILK